MSHSDWESHRQELAASLARVGKDMEEGGYYTVGYNSPWSTKNRRNEVWMPADMNDIDMTKPQNEEVAS